MKFITCENFYITVVLLWNTVSKTVICMHMPLSTPCYISDTPFWQQFATFLGHKNFAIYGMSHGDVSNWVGMLQAWQIKTCSKLLVVVILCQTEPIPIALRVSMLTVWLITAAHTYICIFTWNYRNTYKLFFGALSSLGDVEAVMPRLFFPLLLYLVDALGKMLPHL